jgi:calcium-dependent protein kinase
MTSTDRITFFLHEKEISFELVEKDQLVWRGILKQYLNQVGFHEQFKPIKKIGKGNFASVYLAEKLEDGKKYAVKAFAKEAAYS